MATATETTASSSEILCKCGDDHRAAGSRGCPVFEIINLLTKKIEEFLDVQQVLKFGEDGPMEMPLRDLVRSKFTNTMRAFIEYDQLIRRHPEWSMNEEFSRLRKYFDDVARSCLGDQDPSILRKPLGGLVERVESDSQSLRSAKDMTLLFWTGCNNIISQYARSGAVPVSYTMDPEGYMSKVDKGFKRAVEAILPLSETEKTEFDGLMNGAYRLWAESRRLLCDFKRPPRHAIL